jgi:hypothetical protein
MEIKEWVKDCYYDPESQKIFSIEGKHLIDIRGWGDLSKVFKSDDERNEFQDKLGSFIAEAINEKANPSKPFRMEFASSITHKMQCLVFLGKWEIHYRRL